MLQLAWFISPDVRSELHVENNNPNDRSVSESRQVMLFDYFSQKKSESVTSFPTLAWSTIIQCSCCRMPVRLNMSLAKIKCDFVGIDIQDDMGRHEVGFVENTVKTPIGINEEGCLFEARFHVNKVRQVKKLGIKCQLKLDVQ